MYGHRQPVSVTGGIGGITAECEQIAGLGRHFGAAATDTLGAAWSLHGYLVHPGLATSALLDPLGYAQFEAALLDALDGPHGLTWSGSRCGVLDGELRLAAAAYEAADEVCTRLRDQLTGLVDLPAALVAGGGRAVRTGDLGAAGQVVLARDPELGDVVVDGLHLPALDAALAGRLDDGHGVVRSLGTDTSRAAARPPRGLTDLLRDLARRDDDPHHGAIDVRIITLADGTRRVVVDITGTKSWTPAHTADVTSMSTNERALVGERGAYEDGVLAAMRDAGVRPHDDVLIVGHSEGGMVAVTAARDAVRSGRFNVTHVVTAGSPVGRTVGELPKSVKVLALENSQDVVPHLDGVANPDRPNVTTVSGRRGNGTLVDDHSITDSYVPLAADAQASHDVSVRDFVRSADGYFQGTSVRTHTYQVVRRY